MCVSQPSEPIVHASFENAQKAGRGTSQYRQQATHTRKLNMAKGKSERKSGAAAEEEQEQKLQAILLADSFNTNFRPISSDMPKVRASRCVCFRAVLLCAALRAQVEPLPDATSLA